jgi:CW_7 repeat
MCQLWTRTIFGAPSVGDVDFDGDADAVDGWKKEPKRHPGDRHPPRGVPLAWSGGSKGHGHRAVSLGNQMVRSIDVYGPGSVGTVRLDWFEKNWDMKYLGWSETISGLMIPLPILPKPAPPKKSLRKIAEEVIDGKWGIGIARMKKLTAAGYNAADVQAEVNKLLS